MKKAISVFLLVIIIVTISVVLASCKKEITCDACGETKTTEPHEIEVKGEKATLCDECYKEWQELQEAFKELGDLGD